MLLTGNDRLAGWSIWLFLFSVLRAAGVGSGPFGALLQVVLAAVLATFVGRVLPENDDGRRLPSAASVAIITLALVILMSVALGNALSRRAGAAVAG